MISPEYNDDSITSIDSPDARVQEYAYTTLRLNYQKTVFFSYLIVTSDHRGSRPVIL